MKFLANPVQKYHLDSKKYSPDFKHPESIKKYVILETKQGGARVWNFSSEGGQSDLACFLSAPGSVLTPPVLAGHLLHVCVCMCVCVCV